MSWNSTPIEPSDIGHIYTAIDEARCMPGSNPTPVEHEKQIEAAKEAARLLIFVSALGPADDGRIFLVDLHGHANPRHMPTPGWANDAISVNVRSEPADSDAVRYAREAYERYQAMQAEKAKEAAVTE